MLSELAVDLFKDPDLHIKILTGYSYSDGGKFKSYVQLKTSGKKPVIASVPNSMQKTPEESLEVFVVSLREMVETKEMKAIKLAMEKRYKDFEADDKEVAQSSSHS